MIEVIIVDDEPYVREMIIHMVDWESLSMQVVAECFNGEEALKLIMDDSKNISLVITDLKMPVMDGLELIEKALFLKPGLNFIAVSAYDDFHLVKSAFKLGVKDYLLKSEMTKEQIHSIMTHMIIRMRDHARESTIPLGKSADSFVSNPESNNEYLKETLLSRLANGNCNSDDVKKLKELLCITRESKIVFIMIKRVCMDDRKMNTDHSLKQIISQGMKDFTEALNYSNELHFEVVQLTPNIYTLLAAYSGQESVASIIKQLRSLHACLNQQGTCVNTGLSNIDNDFSNISKLMVEAKESMEYCFVTGNGTANRYSSIFGQTKPLYVDPFKQVTKLKDFLNAVYVNQYSNNINDVIIHPGNIYACNINEVKEIYMRYHFVITDFAKQSRVYDQIKDLCEAYEKNLKHHSDLDGLNKWLTSIMDRIVDGTRNSSVISQIKHYIENHYDKDLSLQSVAEEFKLSGNYLSRLFSEKESTTFIDYLSYLRIIKAIELMKTTNLKIYEIAEKVGYTNPEHFSRTFKRITGANPKQFMSGKSG